MHLDAEEIALGSCERALEQVLAVAESDLERTRRLAAEQPIEVELAGVELNPVARPELGERTLLRLGDAPGAHHIGAHAAQTIRRFCHGAQYRIFK